MRNPGAAIILAAGASRRMGSAKALLPWAGTTFLKHLCAQIDPLGLDHRYVVTRQELVAHLESNWPLCLNPDPDRGMLSSIQTGLARLPADCPWLMVALVDQPAINFRTFQKMLAQASSAGWSSPVYQGRRGHPVIIGSECFPALRAASPEGNPREILSQFPRTLVEVDDPAICLDFDRPEELAAFRTSAADVRILPPEQPEPTI